MAEKDSPENKSWMDSLVGFLSKYSEKGYDYSKILALKGDVYLQERKLKSHFAELGELFYDLRNKKTSNEDIFKELIPILSQLDKIREKMKHLENEIETLKNESKITEKEYDDLLDFAVQTKQCKNQDDFDREYLHTDPFTRNKKLESILHQIRKQEK